MINKRVTIWKRAEKRTERVDRIVSIRSSSVREAGTEKVSIVVGERCIDNHFLDGSTHSYTGLFSFIYSFTIKPWRILHYNESLRYQDRYVLAFGWEDRSISEDLHSREILYNEVELFVYSQNELHL